jgi:anti-sigma factor RsiW
VQLELSHREAKSLFSALVDDELAPPQAQRLQAHLGRCDECRVGWDRYHRTVERVRGLERERAPDHLASLIARRVRRRRGPKLVHLAHLRHRVPVEAIVPLLIGVAVAALLVLMAPS